MVEQRRVIIFSNQGERIRLTVEAMRRAGFEVVIVSDQPLLMREVRNARDRVVLLDFSSKDIDGMKLLHEIKHLEGSIQILVINAEPRVYAGIQIFRAGGEACFFQPAPANTELCDALEDAFRKIARWWRTLQNVSASRTAIAASSPADVASGETGASDARHPDQYPRPGEEIELIVRGRRLKGKGVTSSTTGMDVVMLGAETPALLDTLVVRYRGIVSRCVVRRISSHSSGSWLIGLEWNDTVERPAPLAGARAERALFVTLDGYRVVARSLAAVNEIVISARLATGRVHAVPTAAVRAMTRLEREEELFATEDLSFLVDFYELAPLASRTATVQDILAIEFALEDDVA